MEGYAYERKLDDGRSIAVTLMAFGKGRINIVSVHNELIYDDAW